MDTLLVESLSNSISDNISWSTNSDGTWTIGDIYTSPGDWTITYPTTAPNIYPDITIPPYPGGATGAVFQPLVFPLPGTYEFEQLVDAVVKRISEAHPEVIEDSKSRRKIKKAVGRMLRPVK